MIDIPEGVHRVRGCSIRCGAGTWVLAGREESAIRDHWKKRSSENPKFFDGRVYVMTSGRLRDGCLEGNLPRPISPRLFIGGKPAIATKP